MGSGSHYVNSLKSCLSTEDYNEWINNRYNNIDDDDDGKIIPKWSYLPYCDEFEKYREFRNIICSDHRLHRSLVECKFCQNDFKTFNDEEERCSFCC